MNSLLILRYTALAIAIVLPIVAVHWIYKKILKIAKVKNIVDKPNARKLQKAPVPVMGGMAVFFGILLSVAVVCCFVPDAVKLLPIMLGAGVMLYTGMMDDILALTPLTRLNIEIGVMLLLIFGGNTCVDTMHGMLGIWEFSWWIAVPLTVFAGVGIINAVNMIDGVNGLSSGMCMVICTIFACLFWWLRDIPNAILAASSAAALLPFLVHNVMGVRSKMFIGDCGTMTMGVLMTWFIMKLMSSTGPAIHVNTNLVPMAIWAKNQVCWPAVLLAIMCVPVGDTLRVMTMRMVHGYSPFQADRTHLHHVILKYGNSHSVTAVTEILISVVVSGIWLISWYLGAVQWVQLAVVISSTAIFVMGLYFLLERADRLNTGLAFRIRRMLSSARQGESSWWMRTVRWLDYGAYTDYLLYQRWNCNKTSFTDEEKDLARVINFLQCRSRVMFGDIVTETGFDADYVESLLASLEKKNMLATVLRTSDGKYHSVKLIKF